MDRVSRRSAGSAKKGTRKTGRSMSAQPDKHSKKSTRSKKSRKSTGRYSKLNVQEEDEEMEMIDLNQINYGAIASAQIGKGGEMRPHDIYENTQYIPNKELRLLDIPLNSSLQFQKLLYYHGTYQFIYIILMLMGQIHRLQTRLVEDTEKMIMTVSLFIWVPLEYFRIRTGYKGNINETFPELIAF